MTSKMPLTPGSKEGAELADKILNETDALHHVMPEKINRTAKTDVTRGGKNMPTRECREVDFHKYCPKCKHWGIEDIMDPCNECLGEPCNKNSEKPVYYEPATESYINPIGRKKR